MSFSTQNIRTDSLKKLYQHYGIEADVLRLDEVDRVVSGNKWFKLKEYISEAQQLQKGTILTFGGAYSNHIVATAAACQIAGLDSIGIIRGEESPNLSPTLVQANGFGMKLHFVSRSEYKNKALPAGLDSGAPGTYIINEGGYGALGCKGAAHILSGVQQGKYSHILASVGTGTTLAGLVLSASESKVIGISALKRNHDLEQQVAALLPAPFTKSFEIRHDFHFGGYAKHTPSLLQFMNEWYRLTGIPSDIVYTGKLFFAVDSLIRSKFFPTGSNLLIVHSGGLQGNCSLLPGTLIF